MDVFYTDDTKLKDLTVGQLKDIIIETLGHNIVSSERRQYSYIGGYAAQPRPAYPDPAIEPYCGLTTDEEV